MERFKLTPEPQEPQRDRGGEIKLGALGQPLQTIYLRGRTTEIQRLREHMIKFCTAVNSMVDSAGDWHKVCDEMGLSRNKLPAIDNDPHGYSLFEIITDIENQLTGVLKNHKPKDIPMSMVNRINWLVHHLIYQWNMPELSDWLIDIQDPNNVRNMLDPSLFNIGANYA